MILLIAAPFVKSEIWGLCAYEEKPAGPHFPIKDWCAYDFAFMWWYGGNWSRRV